MSSRSVLRVKKELFSWIILLLQIKMIKFWWSRLYPKLQKVCWLNNNKNWKTIQIMLSLYFKFYSFPPSNLCVVFIRRDLREDMSEFIKKHDEEERRKSKRRMSKMSENERRRQSMNYRRQSTIQKPSLELSSPPNGVHIVNGSTAHPPADVAYVADNNGNLQQQHYQKQNDSTTQQHNGSPPSVNMMTPVGEDNEAYHKEIPVYYNNKGLSLIHI